jgi:enamine deaminase RidA (YjgF/YER057c/UK114 family)
MLNEPSTCERSAIQLSVTRAGEGRTFFVCSARLPADARKTAREAYLRVAEVIRKRRLAIVHERIFGSLSVERPVMEGRNVALRQCGLLSDNPVTYIQGHPLWGEGLAGMLIQAVSPDQSGDVWTITDGGAPCGRGWRRNGSTCLMLQNISSRATCKEAKHLQTRHMLDRAERLLRENGASYRDVVRTWFYVADILDWYADFNKVRSEKYGEIGIMPGPDDGELLLPASTGICGETPSGAAAAMDLLAIVGETGSRPAVKQLTNPTQLDAFRYGSAFSRGALIQEPDVSLLEVSGTAAIDHQGKTRFVEDIRGQITCTFDKIEKLVRAVGAELTDIAAATVFVKRPEHAALFWEMARERGVKEFPAVCVVADVCRDELLFEIDAEAVVRNGVKEVKASPEVTGHLVDMQNQKFTTESTENTEVIQ